MLAAAVLNSSRPSILSALRSCSAPAARVASTELTLSKRLLTKSAAPIVFSTGKNVSIVLPNGRGVLLMVARQSHGAPTMPIRAGRYEWNKFKDYMGYYFCLGLIPVGLVALYANIFVGPAELAEIPEGYQPQDFEYEKHPITRFLTKHIFVSPQRNYEKMMHYWWEESEKQRFRLLRRKVNEAMALQEDYKSWYYVPADSSGVGRSREASEQYYENLGQEVTGGGRRN